MSYQLYWALVGAAVLAVVVGIGAAVYVLVNRRKVQQVQRQLAAPDIVARDAVGARSVDQVLIGNWQATGAEPRVPQYSVDIGVTWTDNDGEQHQWAGTELFPNVLAEYPLPVLRGMMEEFILRAVRVRLGIDGWGE